MITTRNGIYYSDRVCLCSICREAPHCRAIHGLVQVCEANCQFNLECSKFAKKQGKGFQCPCNQEEK